jgi:hypothetical protein
MHHVFDETPDEMAKKEIQFLPTTTDSTAIYNDNIGLARPILEVEQVNTSQYRFDNNI